MGRKVKEKGAPPAAIGLSRLLRLRSLRLSGKKQFDGCVCDRILCRKNSWRDFAHWGKKEVEGGGDQQTSKFCVELQKTYLREGRRLGTKGKKGQEMISKKATLRPFTQGANTG